MVFGVSSITVGVVQKMGQLEAPQPLAMRSLRAISYSVGSRRTGVGDRHRSPAGLVPWVATARHHRVEREQQGDRRR